MLVLSRYRGEAIWIGDNIKIMVTDVNGKQVRLGIEAPQEVAIDREEIRRKKLGEGAEEKQIAE